MTKPSIKIDEREVAASWDVDAPTGPAEVRAGHDRAHKFFTTPRFMEFLPDLAALIKAHPEFTFLTNIYDHTAFVRFVAVRKI